MLTLTELDRRDVPAVHVLRLVSVGEGTTPTIVILSVQGDPQHGPGHTILLPAQSGGPFDRIDVRA